MKIAHKKISEFTDVITGGTPSTSKPEYWDGNIPWLNSGILNDGDVYRPSKLITERGLKNSAAKLMPQNTVLIALTGATTGQVGYLQIEAAANQSVTGILPSKEHHSRYLYYYLRTKKQIIQGDAFGGAQPHINQQYVKDFTIPLPPLDDQIRIATVLTRAERLIAKRKESIKALDELLKSRFLEMFGDPSKAKSTDNVKTIEEVCQYKGGGTPSKAKPEYFTGDIPWVSPKDMKSLYINTSIDKITQDAIDNSSASLIPKWSVLMVVRSGILKNKLPVAINTVDVTINQDMKAFASKKVLAPYLLYFFISNERYMLKKVRATTADNFNFDDIRKMSIIIPPFPLQNQFAVIVEKVESIKAKQAQSLAELENLYVSLSQRAFKGELDLSRVAMERSLT